MTLATPERNVTEVLIIGGGTMGLAIAVELALQGAKPTILTRNCEEAALYAAAGMLAPQAEQLPPGPMLDLCLASRDLYPHWIERLQTLTGLDAGYWPCGILAPVYGDHAVHPSSTPSASWLTPKDIQQQQPGLASKVSGAWWYPQDGQVDNRALGQTLMAAASILGIHIKRETTVTEFLHSGNRLTGLVTSSGQWQADHYILTSGAWSQSLLKIPVIPRKGQMLSLAVPAEQPRPLDCVIFAPDIYLVPRLSERVVIGATSEDVGFQSGNSPRGIQQLLGAAVELCPALTDCLIEEFWWGFRPLTPDELPILGQGAWDNFWLATGHYRNGILLAPITAHVISQALQSGHPPMDLSPFSYLRFHGQSAP